MTAAVPTADQATSMKFLSLAVRIADHAVRSDIELYATGEEINGTWYYDTTEPDTGGDDDGRARYQAIVDDALAYIEQRGDVFPWRLVRHEREPAVVRFEDKEPVR